MGVNDWSAAIPQYELGHGKIMDKLKEIESRTDDVWIMGNYRTSVVCNFMIVLSLGVNIPML